MTKILPYSTEWSNARKTYLMHIMGSDEYKDSLPYTGYKRWLKQFGAVETLQSINIRNDADAVAFKLRFGYNKA